MGRNLKVPNRTDQLLKTVMSDEIETGVGCYLDMGRFLPHWNIGMQSHTVDNFYNHLILKTSILDDLF